MTGQINRRILLKSRPDGIPVPGNFELDQAPVPEPGAGQVLIRTAYLSVDPAMKGWISAVANYAEPVAVGAVMRAITVGEVVASNRDDYRAGEIVLGMQGWQDYALSDGSDIQRKVDPGDGPISTALGILGHTGLTAYFGLLDVGQPRDGETVLVSTAAGSVGSVVGQIAGIKGCRAVGLTGSDDKAALCRSEFGYDETINYKTAGNLDAALAAACPDGIDVYFDNVGGATLDAVLRHINIGARVIVCGTASVAAWDPPPIGPRVERHILVKRARMQGILIFDYAGRTDEGIRQMAEWMRAGRLHYREDVVDGIENAPAALAGLYRGENMGKMLIRTRPEAG